MKNNSKTRVYLLSIATILISLASTGCGDKKNNKANEEATPLTVTEPVTQKETITALPDTAYASVSLIKYKVEILDTINDPKINDFTDLYTDAPGIFTFRGNPKRNADFGGTVQGTPSMIEVDWEFTTAITPPDSGNSTWGGGTGWSGQPVYVNWPDSVASRFKVAGVVNANFKNQEIILGSLCQRIYFIDFVTGKASRNAIDARNPIKGSASLDPTLNGNLYVGHGVPSRQPFGHMVIDLDKGEVSKLIPQDRKAQRGWGAFDSSPLRVDRFLLWPGENGTLYKYICADGDLIPHSTLRYTRNGAAPGMESSIAVYRNYGYTADNHGIVVCTNLNTMQPVWCFDNGDDSDATVVISEEEGTPYIYTGCEVDRKPAGPAYFRKLNALTGELVWELSTPGRRADVGEKHFDGGYYATPLLGKGNCSDLIFNNCVANTKGQNGDFIAINRKTGEIVYKVKLKHYAWSSPVGLMNEKDEMFIVTGDTQGHVYLINGIDGTIIDTKLVGANFESSPVVVGNQIVVGSRGNSIFKMSIK